MKKNNRGYFGIGVENSKNGMNIGTLWRTANIFGAAFIFTIGNRYELQKSDTMCTPKHIPYFAYPDFSTFYNNKPEKCPIVGIEINKKSVPISQHIHFERCVYLLGAEDRGLTSKALSKCQVVIQLPGTKCLNVATAGSIVLFDRINKRLNGREKNG